MWTRQVDWIEPIEAARRLSALPRLALLDSAMTHPTLGRWSTLAADPFATFRSGDGGTFWNGEAVDKAATPLTELRGRLARYATPPDAGLPPFAGGAIGRFAYEFGWTLEDRLPPHPRIAPDIDLAFYDTVLAFDHAAHRCLLVASGHPAPTSQARHVRARRRLASFERRLARPVPPRCPARALEWQPTQPRDAYLAGVDAVKAFIRAGDIYQANIARVFRAELPPGTDPLALYETLRLANPAPFAACLADDAGAVLSTSPELFLRSDGRHVETRPIKGTIRRHADASADRDAAEALLASPKDRAENIMIVDLLRNDLSRVCEPASVDVPALCELESYSGLHHLVSVVTGRLRPSCDVLDLLAASFPGGSITGAPKLRAMEIIAAVEGASRGAYCGAIGSLGFDGSMQLNIAIRTLVLAGDAAELRVGGGITVLSDAATEYEETLTKAHRITQASAPQALAHQTFALQASASVEAACA